MNNKINDIIKSENISQWGIVKNSLKQGSIIIYLLPYYFDRSGEYNLCRYASVKDYHLIAKDISGRITARLREISNGEFAAYCDSSPVREVEAAAQAGLGIIGNNNLLINPKYGSYVFIAEIICNIPLECSKSEKQECLKCMKCVENCPSQALSINNGNVIFESAKCLSAITQRKGELQKHEKYLIKKSGVIWGCDVCQEVCPMNQKIEYGLEVFTNSASVKQIINYSDVKKLEESEFKTLYSDRAFTWRGVDVIKRNLEIIQ